MGEGRKGKSLAEKIREIDEEIEKIDRREEERVARNLEIDEEIAVKSRLDEREIIEEEPKKEKKSVDTVFAPVINVVEQPSFSSIVQTPKASLAAASGRSLKAQRVSFTAVSLEGLAKEVVARHFESKTRYKIAHEGMTNESRFQSMWNAKKMSEVAKEKMVDDLKGIEGRTKNRISRMNELSMKREVGGMSAQESIELKNLQKEEVNRYWIRQHVISDMPLRQQENMNFLRPVGEGAYGVMPVTYFTRYDQLDQTQKKASRWIYDNVMLRWQGSLYGKFVPKVSQAAWYKKKVTKDIENVLDDVDEEIYCDKEFQAALKKGQAQLEDMEEELTGYDRFTTSEEAEIKKYVSVKLKEQAATDKEPEFYG